MAGRRSLTGGVMLGSTGDQTTLVENSGLQDPIYIVPEAPPLRMLYPVCMSDEVDRKIVDD
jgi:hypothetical protein